MSSDHLERATKKFAVRRWRSNNTRLNNDGQEASIITYWAAARQDGIGPRRR